MQFQIFSLFLDVFFNNVTIWHGYNTVSRTRTLLTSNLKMATIGRNLVIYHENVVLSCFVASYHPYRCYTTLIRSCIWSSFTCYLDIAFGYNSGHHIKHYRRRGNCSQTCFTFTCISRRQLCHVVSYWEGQSQPFSQPTHGKNGRCWAYPCSCTFSMCNHASSFSCCWKFILNDGARYNCFAIQVQYPYLIHLHISSS